MKIRKAITLTLIVSLCIPVRAQDDVALFNFWQYHSDVENSLYKHFCSVAFEQLESRQAAIGKLATETDWLERQAMVRQTRDRTGPVQCAGEGAK